MTIELEFRTYPGSPLAVGAPAHRQSSPHSNPAAFSVPMAQSSWRQNSASPLAIICRSSSPPPSRERRIHPVDHLAQLLERRDPLVARQRVEIELDEPLLEELVADASHDHFGQGAVDPTLPAVSDGHDSEPERATGEFGPKWALTIGWLS